MKKGLLLLLAVVQVISCLVPIKALGSGNDPDLYQGLSGKIPYAAVKAELPLGTPQYNKDNLPLNTEIWQDKHLVVYGDYTTVNYGAANVKFYHEGDYNHKGSFYFRDKEGINCEYRYLGYTRAGNKFPNPKFPADYRTDTPPEDITWYAHPWALHKHYMKEPSYTNKQIIEEEISNLKAIEYINASLDWRINKAIDGSTRQRLGNAEIKELKNFHFFNVDSPPSTHAPGRGRMINHSYSKKKDYYWTFSIPAVKGKDQTPVAATCTILNKSELNFGTGEEKKIALVEVTGVLLDEFCYDRVAIGKYSGEQVDAYERSINYCREDIKDWNITLHTPGGLSLEKVSKSNINSNGIKHIFEVELSRDYVESGRVEFHTSVYINYLTGEKSNTATAMDSMSIQTESGILSLFSVTNPIVVQDINQYTSADVNYQDSSVGSIVKYTWQMVNLTSGEEYSFSYPIAISSRVNNEIHKFSKDFFSAMQNFEDRSGQVYPFVITQIVSNESGESSSCTRQINFQIGQDFSPPALVEPRCSIPDKAIDMVAFKPTDNTDTDQAISKKVSVDGRAVDYNRFFSGSYTFSETIGLLGINNRLVKVEVSYTSIDNIESHYTTWVYVYTSKPRLDYSISGTLKVNRRIDLINESEALNDEYVVQKYPITYSWAIEAIKGDNSSLRMRAGYQNNPMQKTFIYKEEGVYRFTLTGHNGLRAADPYSIDIPVAKDYKPAVIFNVWNKIIARNEQLHIGYEGVSLEGDQITKQILEIYADRNNDGEFETKIRTYSDATSYDGYIPTELGSYQMVCKVFEEFGQETLPEFIRPNDRRSTIEKREFHVENLSPMTKLYVDIPLNFPEADLYVLTDPGLNTQRVGEVKGKRIDLVNDLRQSSIVPEVNIWDLHTYTYSQEVTKSKHTGRSRPPSTIKYNHNGYSGTLNRYRIVDDDYKVDRGRYETKTKSKTVSRTRTSTAWTKYNQGGWPTSSYSPSNPSISYNRGGYKGTLRKTGYRLISTRKSYWPNGKIKKKTKKYRGYYRGTVRKKYRVWVSKWVTKHDYTGYYRGNVHKKVKQPFNNIFRDTSDKYIVYLADSFSTGQDELNMIRDISDSKVIYVGALAHRDDIKADHFIPYDGDIDSIFNKVLQIIKQNNPYQLMYTLLLDENISIKCADLDAEDDPIPKREHQIVHNPDVFDNNTGLAKFADTEFSAVNYRQMIGSELNLEFSDKGLYQVYRRVTDSPVGHADKGLNSNEPKLEIIVHEKPVADFDFEWLYNYKNQVYETIWVDKSYDPDFEYSRPDKGIIDRKIRFRKVGGHWKYRIPQTLDLGSYQLEYRVKDVFGVWSDVKKFNFTLRANPPIAIKYTINYQCAGETFFSETITDTLQGIKQKSKTFQARDFTPLYSLADSRNKTATACYQQPNQVITFNYDLMPRLETNIEVRLGGERLQPGNLIAAGYGVTVDALVNIDSGIATSLLNGTPQVELEWLKERPYEWTFEKMYQVSNIYPMEWVNGPIDQAEFKLRPNPDSKIRARKFYTPVELHDGDYQVKIRLSGIKYPVWDIDEQGNVVQGEDVELKYETNFSITIKGTMYDDINIIS